MRDVLRGELFDGEPMDALTVLKPDNDPFRIGTPAHHTMGRFVRETLDPHADLSEVYARGVHYLATGGPPRPVDTPEWQREKQSQRRAERGEPPLGESETEYLNTETNWKWMQAAVKVARWLPDPATGTPYVDFDRVVDERNDAPVLRLAEKRDPDPWVVTGTGLTVAEVKDLQPYADLGDVRVPQPFRIVMWGEKSSLERMLASIADDIEADYCVGTGETSDTILHTLAKTAVDDGRPLVVVVVADFDGDERGEHVTRMDFQMVRRETAERLAAEAFARGRAEGAAEAAARPAPPKRTARKPPLPKPRPKAPTRHAREEPPKPRVIEHLCPNVDPMSNHRGKVVIGADGHGVCDWCGRGMWADS